MSSYKVINNENGVFFLGPYQDLLISMTDTLKKQDYIGYMDLVHQLRNLAILAFEKRDFEILSEMNRIIVVFKKHIDYVSKEKIDGSRLYQAERVDYELSRNADLKIFCEYRFAGVMMRVCVAALRKTIFLTQVPNAQIDIFYDGIADLKECVACFNEWLIDQGITPCEVEVRI